MEFYKKFLVMILMNRHRYVVIEKSWKSHGILLGQFRGNPGTTKPYTIIMMRTLRKRVAILII